MHRVHVRLSRRRKEYEITIGPGLLDKLGNHARKSFLNARRIVIISNSIVFDHYGDIAARSLSAAGFQTSSWLMQDGERHKSLRSYEGVLEFLTKSKLERTDGIVALGGGVVGDLAGFAAATFLRGIDYLQVPTSLLAQIDASVGGKTGINSTAGKNVIGAFHQPCQVLIDTETLHTLPRRELTSGWCECIKQGAVGSRALFDKTVAFLENGVSSGSNTGGESLAKLIAAHCTFKARIVSGDEHEAVERVDYRSRRILNFGHTIAHAMEVLTGFRRYRHGEAVGYGMLVAGELSKRLGILPESDLESLRAAIHLAGRLPHANDLEPTEIMAALAHDKKSVGGQIQWILLERLGRARIVDGNEIAPRVLRSSIRAALQSINYKRVR